MFLMKMNAILIYVDSFSNQQGNHENNSQLDVVHNKMHHSSKTCIIIQVHFLIHLT